jgi:CubicO group peptidase (beta-lactamase class C family)
MGKIMRFANRFGRLAAAFALALAPAATAAPPAMPQAPAAPASAASSITAAAGKLAPGQPIPPAQLESFIDGAVADAMMTDHISGVTVSVVQGGKIVLLKGYGVSDTGPGKAVDPQRTLFRIASISKTFTWVLLMKEVEKGKVRLDAPVNDYLPPELKIPDEGFKQPIRIVNLMSHSAGFEDSAFGHLFVDSGERIVPTHDYLMNHRPRRVREPGQLASYSNYSAALAGYIVARLEGVDYQTLVERDVLGPIGMTSTSFREPYAARPGLPAPMPADLAGRLSRGFMWKGGEFHPAAFEYVNQIASAGGASTTAADMARYMLVQLRDGKLENGQQLYGPVAAQAFRTPVLNVPDQVNGWAHGLMMRPLAPGFQSYGHGGSLMSFYSNMVVVPTVDLGLFVSTNTDTGRAFTDRLPKLLIQRFYAPDPAQREPGDPSLVKDAKVYAGGYVPTRRTYSGLEAFIDLFMEKVSVSVTKSGYLQTNIAGQTQEWVPDGERGHFRAIDGDQKMRFDFDAAGRAKSFLYARGNSTMERATFVQKPMPLMALAFLTFLAAIAAWVGQFTRRRPAGKLSRWQQASNALGLAAGAGWLVAFAAFFDKLMNTSAPDLMFRWPGPVLLIATWSALAATVTGLGMLVLTPMTWRRDPTVEADWSAWRKARNTLAAVVFVAFGALVWARGGLPL